MRRPFILSWRVWVRDLKSIVSVVLLAYCFSKVSAKIW
jgi:hypothetical protein